MPTSSARLSTTLLAAALLVPMVSGAQSAPLPPIIEDPRIQDVVASSSAERIRKDITALVNFGTRHTMSDTLSNTRGIGAARRWIFAEFEKISKACGGCLEVRYISDIVKGDPNGRIKQDINVVNVVAILRGTTEPNRFMVHTGDIDSRVTDVLNATSDSPGANDNASGIAALLEAARLMSKHKFAASVAWVALSSEEQGLQGGDIVAKAAQREGWRIDAVINNDMVGNSRGIDGVFENTKARVFAPGLPANTPAAEMRRILTMGGSSIRRAVSWRATST